MRQDRRKVKSQQPTEIKPRTPGWSHQCSCYNVLYSGKLLREKISQISQFCGYLQKFSPQNLGRGVLWHGISEQSTKVVSAKIILFTNPQKFSPSKVSLYTVLN